MCPPPLLVLGGSAEAREGIAAAVATFPPRVQAFAARRCAFLVLRFEDGFVVNQADVPRAWYVCLRWPTPDLRRVIAHELAHAVRGHRGFKPRWEEAADALARTWLKRGPG